MLLLKLWKRTLPKHSELRCCKKNLKVTKNVLLNRALDFVVAKYVRMWNFVVAKINQQNRVITKNSGKLPIIFVWHKMMLFLFCQFGW